MSDNWQDMTFTGGYDSKGRRVVSHPSTFEAECKQLRTELEEAKSAAAWDKMRGDTAIEETRQLRGRVAAIGAALERLDASLFTNAEHQQAKDILRAALQEDGE